MNTHAIWKLIQDSRECGVSFDKVTQLRRNDSEGGVKGPIVWKWQRKLLNMYRRASRMTFLGVNRLAICTDASTHNNKDYLMSLAYDPSNDVAVHMCSVHVRSAKCLYPGEMELTAEAERLAARRETERLSSLKFLQAVSCQLEKLTDLCMDDFRAPDWLLRLLTLQPGDQYAYNPVEKVIVLNEEATPVDEACDGLLSSLPCLHVIMDQGKVGCAAAAWLAGQGGILARFTFDKVHRLLRDLKNPLSKAKLDYSVMVTSYIFSVNHKPFGSGQWFTEKQHMMESFFEANTAAPCLY